jgi:DNA-binding XRE family transcriptional regulator
MEFMVTKDIESVMEIIDSTMEDLAEELGVSRITIEVIS